MKKSILIDRYSNEKEQTIGKFYLLDEETQSVIKMWHSMELPWLDNTKRISCIPTGNYKAVIHYSPKFGKCLWLQDVPNRSEILIHAANFYYDLLGCIGIGKDLVDIDGDSFIDVTSSRDSLTELMELLDNQTVVDIQIR
jgi:hypothetical protein